MESYKRKKILEFIPKIVSVPRCTLLIEKQLSHIYDDLIYVLDCDIFVGSGERHCNI